MVAESFISVRHATTVSDLGESIIVNNSITSLAQVNRNTKYRISLPSVFYMTFMCSNFVKSFFNEM